MHPVAASLQLETLVDEEGRVATIIHDQLGAVVAFVGKCEVCLLYTSDAADD